MLDYRKAQRAKQNIKSEIEYTKQELDDLDKTLENTTQKFYKQLCDEVENDPDVQEQCEHIYVDTVNQWKNDVHDIEVHIIQLSQWLKNEERRGFKARFMKREDLDTSGRSYKPVKRLQSGRERSAKSVVTDDYRPRGRRSRLSGRTSSSTCYDEAVDLTAVKVNRTLQLRKAQTERKIRENSKDPFYIPPQKRRYKKLHNYAKEDVYNRLNRTTTIAYDNQQKLKSVLRSSRRINSSSSTTLLSKADSLISERSKRQSAKAGTHRNNEQPLSAKGKNVSFNAGYQDPEDSDSTFRDGDSKKGAGQRKSKRGFGGTKTKIPRPMASPVGKKRTSPAGGLSWTRRHKVVSSNKATVSSNNRQASPMDITEATVLNSGKPQITSGKLSSASNWEELSQIFGPDSLAIDNFSDMKSSYVGAQKIYGIPKKKGTFKNFFKRNFGKKQNKNLKIGKIEENITENDVKFRKNKNNTKSNNTEETIISKGRDQNEVKVKTNNVDVKVKQNMPVNKQLDKGTGSDLNEEKNTIFQKPVWKVRPMRFNSMNRNESEKNDSLHNQYEGQTKNEVSATLQYPILPAIKSNKELVEGDGQPKTARNLQQDKRISLQKNKKIGGDGALNTEKTVTNRNVKYNHENNRSNYEKTAIKTNQSRRKPIDEEIVVEEDNINVNRRQNFNQATLGIKNAEKTVTTRNACNNQRQNVNKQGHSQQVDNNDGGNANDKENQLAILKRLVLLEKKPKSALPGKKTDNMKEAGGGRKSSKVMDISGGVRPRKSQSDHSHILSANVSEHNSGRENGEKEKSGLVLLQRKIFKMKQQQKKKNLKQNVQNKSKNPMKDTKVITDSDSKGTNSSDKNSQNHSNKTKSININNTHRNSKNNNQATTVPSSRHYSNVKSGNHSNSISTHSLDNGLNSTQTQINSHSNDNPDTNAILSDSAAITRTRNKPKSRIVRKNAFDIEVEELNMEPSEKHVFTKFSDNLGAEKAKKLAKLDERFLRQKARVERSVRTNHIEAVDDHTGESASITGETESFSGDEFEYESDSGSEGEELPTAIKQTLLLRKKINKRKEEIFHSLSPNGTQNKKSGWPYSHVPGFVDKVINSD